jgi:hypothetical protein
MSLAHAPVVVVRAFGSISLPRRRRLMLRVSRWRVVSHNDPFALDPHDGVPGDERMRFLSADAEVLEPGTVSDAETGDSKVRGGELAAEVVATAERASRFGYDLAAQER